MATADLVRAELARALERAADELGWPEGARSATVEVERPKDPAHGDYATSVALKLARPLRTAPLEIAEAIRARVPVGKLIASVEVAKPGFINVRLSEAWIGRQVDAIVGAGSAFGRTDRLRGKRIQVEYISANPTGPMTVANARGGPLGDVIANLLAFHGADVTREFYVDDSGTQTDALGRSVAVRYRELLGDSSVPFPDDGYVGDYVRVIANEFRLLNGDKYQGLSLSKQAADMGRFAIDLIVGGFRLMTERLGIHFDTWTTESSFIESGYFAASVDELRRKGAIEDRDGAVWLRSTDPSDDKEGYVVIRSSGEPTYFGKDIAYHRHCFVERGFDLKIDVWGANTHGHMRKMRQALEALGIPLERWRVVLYQYVRFVHEGVLTRMGKRTGKFLMLEDVVDAVGTDATRFFMLQSSADRQLDFDFELAVQQSNENPVYYVQYAHARIASILRTAAEAGLSSDGADTSLLREPGELDLIRACLRFEELVDELRDTLGVHQLTTYAMELAGLFHGFYKGHRVVGDDPRRSKARLRLVEAVRVTLRQTLGLLGVSAPDSM